MIQIRRCTEGDIPDLIAIALSSYLDNYTYLWQDQAKQYLRDYFNPQQLTQEMQDPEAEFYQIESEQEALGLLKLNLHHRWPTSEHKQCTELERIYLRPRAAGQGLGRQLMDFAAKRAQELGKTSIWLKTMDSSSALGFYQKCGYQIIDKTILDFELIVPQYQGMYVMEKVLEV